MSSTKRDCITISYPIPPPPPKGKSSLITCSTGIISYPFLANHYKVLLLTEYRAALIFTWAYHQISPDIRIPYTTPTAYRVVCSIAPGNFTQAGLDRPSTLSSATTPSSYFTSYHTSLWGLSGGQQLTYLNLSAENTVFLFSFAKQFVLC